MTKPSGLHEAPTDADRRSPRPSGRPLIAGVPVRDDDVQPTGALHSVAILFRVLAGLLVLLIVLQVLASVTGAEPVSFATLLTEVIRLLIFAGVLWAAGDLADLLVTSHHDLRATRILLGRLTRLVDERTTGTGGTHADDGRGRGPGAAS